jgi:aquaporin Z
MTLGKRLAAEAFGTAWLVIGGCGTAIFGGSHDAMGLVGVSLAFGLTVMTMAYAIGHVSGCHLNPAVTIGQVLGKRFAGKDAGPYIAAQVAGAAAGAALIYLMIKLGKENVDPTATGFAANGYGGKFLDVGGAFLAEVLMTFFFLFVILGATDDRAPKGFAPIAIGLCLTLIHLISIPLTNTSVNPARSTSQALFMGGDALEQLWLFWVAPLVGGALAGIVYPAITSKD